MENGITTVDPTDLLPASGAPTLTQVWAKMGLPQAMTPGTAGYAARLPPPAADPPVASAPLLASPAASAPSAQRLVVSCGRQPGRVVLVREIAPDWDITARWELSEASLLELLPVLVAVVKVKDYAGVLDGCVLLPDHELVERAAVVAGRVQRPAAARGDPADNEAPGALRAAAALPSGGGVPADAPRQGRGATRRGTEG